MYSGWCSENCTRSGSCCSIFSPITESSVHAQISYYCLPQVKQCRKVMFFSCIFPVSYQSKNSKHGLVQEIDQCFWLSSGHVLASLWTRRALEAICTILRLVQYWYAVSDYLHVCVGFFQVLLLPHTSQNAGRCLAVFKMLPGVNVCMPCTPWHSQDRLLGINFCPSVKMCRKLVLFQTQS